MRQSGFGIASMVIGIVCLLLSCLGVGFAGILGIIFAIISLCQKEKGHGTAIAGLTCSIVALIISIIVIMPSPTSTDNDTAVATEDVTQTSSPKTSKKKTSNTKPTNLPKTKNISDFEIKNRTIFKKRGISIKTIGNTSENGFISIDVLVKNSSKKDYSISAHSFAINGLMAGGSLVSSDVDVPAGKKAKFSIGTEESWFKENSISSFKKLDVVFWAYYEDVMEIESDLVTIKTNLDNGKYGKIKGKSIYSDSNVSIQYIGVTGNTYKFLVKNKKSYNMDFTLENCSINGWSYDLGSCKYDLYDEPLLKKSCAVFDLVVDDDFLDNNSIKSIKNMEYNIELNRNTKTKKINLKF